MPRAQKTALKIITIRLRIVDVERAVAIAKKTDTRYQQVIRGWVADGAKRTTKRTRG